MHQFTDLPKASNSHNVFSVFTDSIGTIKKVKLFI